MNKKYVLHVKEGCYEADTLVSLMWQIFQHRFHHWRNGDGWRD